MEDTSAINAFFDEYEATFSLGDDTSSFRRSSDFPHVGAKICASDYHEPGTAVDIDWLIVDHGFRGQGLRVAAIVYFQNLAEKHGLALVTWPEDEDAARQFRACGFTLCGHPAIGLGQRLEWPRCAHLSP